MTQSVLTPSRPLPYVLMYHSVAAYSADPHLVTVTPSRFEEQLRWLRRTGWRGVPVRELLEARRRGRARGLVGLTFDDGYADFVETVLPALARHGHNATVFVLAGRLGGSNGWEDGGPRKSLLTADQVVAAARRGVEIGSHGMYHRELGRLDGEALWEEIAAGRAALRELCGQDVGGFCYPYGAVTDTAVEIVRTAGYDYGCAIWRSRLTGRHALPRTYVGDADGPLRLRAKRLRHVAAELSPLGFLRQR